MYDTDLPTRVRIQETGCISLIGMAGAGKSTLGRLLAEKLGWAHLDTDRLIEAYYGLPLQEILDGQGLPLFLKTEETLVSMLGVRRTVISTGGSVVYGPAAMKRLKLLGPVVFLEIDLPTFQRRVGEGDNRGLAIAQGMSREDLFLERLPLYRAAADFTLPTGDTDPKASLDRLHAWLTEEPDQ
ncbi:MAG: AAA family ATPase [Proteobacteria bacterium]|nr:AAA family ATPase [Pseudomonadota bacterium]MBU1595402.1 AAA family ATPase [Pseudomonadota bacterium]